MQPKDWNKIRNILEEQLAGYIGQDEETVNAKLDALVTSLTGELTANVVKSIQQGSISFGGEESTKSITISEVNKSKSYVLHTGTQETHVSYDATGDTCGFALTSPTTVTGYRTGNSSKEGIIAYFTVIEFC